MSRLLRPDVWLVYSQLNDTRLADDQDEQHDDDPAEEQIASRQLHLATAPKLCGRNSDMKV